MSGETETDISGWTVDTLHAHILRVLGDLKESLNERYATQTKAVDAAFSAAEIARQTARIEDQRAVATALLSAEKAVTKAEIAAEKRFESVNEFRAQLADQAATFVSRTEAEAYRLATEAKIEGLKVQLDKLEKRMDLAQGKSAGSAAAIAYAVTAITVVVVVINMMFFVLSK